LAHLAAHEFVEVKDRRWCVRCDLFQMKGKNAAFFPTPRDGCPQTYSPEHKRYADVVSDEVIIDGGIDVGKPNV